MTREADPTKIATMNNPWLGVVGLILGVVVGLLLVLLLSDALSAKGHELPGLIEVIIVFAVAVAGFGAGGWAARGTDRE